MLLLRREYGQWPALLRISAYVGPVERALRATLVATTRDASPAALYGALVFLAMLATLAGVASVGRGALDAREVAPQHAVVAEAMGV